MSNEPRRSILCPNCRKLINADERRCPYCGTGRPGSVLKNNPWTRAFRNPADLIKVVIGINVVMYVIAMLLAPGGIRLSLANPFVAFSPGGESLFLLGATGTIPIDGYGRWWTLLTAAYLHGGLLHIVFNMLAFRHLAGFIIEEYGAYRMLILFTLTSVAGFAVSYLFGVQFTIGASAAICGFIGAIIFYAWSRGGSYGQNLMRQVSGWLIGLLIIGMMPNINNFAHGGGLVAGFALAWLLGYGDQSREGLVQKAAAGFCALATVIGLALAVIGGVYARFVM